MLNGVPVPGGSPDAVRREIGLKEGELLLFAAGTVVPRKGHMVLLQALQRLTELEKRLRQLEQPPGKAF